jgi:hypothetical protein
MNDETARSRLVRPEPAAQVFRLPASHYTAQTGPVDLDYRIADVT